jgi:hypothetical protein
MKGQITTQNLEFIGFRYLGANWYEWNGTVWQFQQGNYRLRLNIRKDKKAIITLSSAGIDDEHIFNGTIKNMKQLKKIFKYLNLQFHV